MFRDVKQIGVIVAKMSWLSSTIPAQQEMMIRLPKMFAHWCSREVALIRHQEGELQTSSQCTIVAILVACCLLGSISVELVEIWRNIVLHPAARVSSIACRASFAISQERHEASIDRLGMVCTVIHFEEKQAVEELTSKKKIKQSSQSKVTRTYY